MFVFVLIGWANLILKAQKVLEVKDLCYTEEYVARVRVTKTVNIESLSFMDKLKFVQKEYVQTHHEYLNEDGFITHDIGYVSSKNMYPNWYTPPVLTRIDQNGIKSFFDETDPNLPDGWAGSVFFDTTIGEYKTDPQTGDKYFEQEYTARAGSSYLKQDSIVKSVGLFNGNVYKYPDGATLNAFGALGYTILVEGDILTVKDSADIFIWQDAPEKIFLHQKINGTNPIETTKMYYSYHEEYADYFVSKVFTVTPGVFDNGDCYDVVTKTTYTYTKNCGQGNGKVKSKMTRHLSGNSNSEHEGLLSVYPNPASGKLHLTIPVSSFASVLKVTDLSGNILLQRKIAAWADSYELNMDNFVNGIYLLKVQQQNNFFSLKFIKQ